MNTIKSAYGAGWRAGKLRRAGARNPFNGWTPRALAWELGFYDGYFKSKGD